MYRSLDAAALGISGRQSELIELALTFGFSGLDIDLTAIVKRARTGSIEQACRFLTSANLRIGHFALPLDFTGSETAFRTALGELKETAAVAGHLRASCCVATVRPASDDLPYHENFELHRNRLGAVANVLAEHDIKLGLAFQAAPNNWRGFDYPFIHEPDALLTLIKTIAATNVGLLLDTWNWFVGGGSLGELTELTAGRIAGVRLADVRLEDDLLKITDQQRYLPFDGGMVDAGAVVRHLAAIGYEGPVALVPHASRCAGMTRDAIARQARATFQDLWIAAGLAPPRKTAAVPVEAAATESVSDGDSSAS